MGSSGQAPVLHSTIVASRTDSSILLIFKLLSKVKREFHKMYTCFDFRCFSYVHPCKTYSNLFVVVIMVRSMAQFIGRETVYK